MACSSVLATTSPVLVSLALLLEVPGAALLAAAILGQVPPPAAVVGLVMILAGMHGGVLLSGFQVIPVVVDTG